MNKEKTIIAGLNHQSGDANGSTRIMKNNNLKQTIEQSVEEFDERFCGEYNRLWLENTAMNAESDCKQELKAHLRTSQTALLTAIEEKLEGMKRKIIIGLDVKRQSRDAFKNLINKGYNTALQEIKDFISEANTK